MSNQDNILSHFYAGATKTIKFTFKTPEHLAKLQIQKGAELKYFRGKLDGLESRLKTVIGYSVDDAHAKVLFEYGLGIALQELQNLGIDASKYLDP